MDEDRLATLKRWGEGLAQDERGEMRAAGKAILMLVEEIERLHVELWHVRMTHGEAEQESEPAPLAAEGQESVGQEQQLDMTLSRRLRLLLRLHAQ